MNDFGHACSILSALRVDSMAHMGRNDKEVLIFLHELAIAYLKKGGNGEIPQQVVDFIKSCYKNGITFKVEVK